MKRTRLFDMAVALMALLFACSTIGNAQPDPNNKHNHESKSVLALQTLYNYLVSPNIQQVFPESGVSPVDALFSNPTQGRIAPFGEGHDLATVKKYFFGLPNDGLESGSAFTVTAVTFRSITKHNPDVSVVVDLTFTPTALGQELGYETFQLRETGQFTFDKKLQITSFDLSIPYVDTAMTSLEGLNFSSPSFFTSSVAAICYVAMGPPGGSSPGACNTANTGFANYNDCYSYLTTLPAGNWNRSMNQNTVACRTLHTQWLAMSPDIECPNVGRTGGTQCADANTYASYFTETF